MPTGELTASRPSLLNRIYSILSPLIIMNRIFASLGTESTQPRFQSHV